MPTPNKCSRCLGYGLWFNDGAPMGPIDASDGMPTKTCPECGANANPGHLLSEPDADVAKMMIEAQELAKKMDDILKNKKPKGDVGDIIEEF